MNYTAFSNQNSRQLPNIWIEGNIFRIYLPFFHTFFEAFYLGNTKLHSKQQPDSRQNHDSRQQQAAKRNSKQHFACVVIFWAPARVWFQQIIKIAVACCMLVVACCCLLLPAVACCCLLLLAVACCCLLCNLVWPILFDVVTGRGDGTWRRDVVVFTWSIWDGHDFIVLSSSYWLFSV